MKAKQAEEWGRDTNMKFEYSGYNPKDNPTADDIKTGLTHLGKTQDSFAILSKSDSTYLQTSGDADIGFVIEYQVGGTENHFQAKKENISLEECTKCFIAYAQNDDSWQKMFAWEKQIIKSGVGCFPLLSFFLLSLYPLKWMARTFVFLLPFLTVPSLTFGMSEMAFWDLIEKSNKSAGQDIEKVPHLLRKELGGLSEKEIIEFKDHFQKKLCEAHTWSLWGAAYIINGGASDDSFDYFKMALIASGKKAFQIGITNPDDLSGIQLKKPEGGFELEDIDYVPDEAFKSKTGKDLDYDPKELCGEPIGKSWQENELPKLFPKLFKKYSD